MPARSGTTFVLALVLLVQCDEPDAPTYQDPALLCIPRLAADWAPAWRPPHAPDGTACTEETIAEAYQTCFGPRSTQEGCRKFATNADTKGCASCLFSSADTSPQGPIVLLPNRSWETNTAGCIALVDGPAKDSGCGARVQAATSCYDAACSKCEPFSAFVNCLEEARQTVCRSYYLDAVCMYRPIYAICTDWATNYEYFVAMSRFFCRNVRPVAGVAPSEKAN